MNKYYYDLHIHSCLSPCADNDMTPENIAGMASLNGLNIVALTDHNTTKNCRAFFAAARRYGIVPIAGMEMTTAEDVHVVALFPTLEGAENFEEEYRKYRILYKNRKDIFGDQLIYGEDDELIGEEEDL
ncbi:MAG: PHP domain-containing protein, partial [Clostridia bacterium]|nr:PHP domain-containing protein [Clostridia bacterium]